MARKLTVNSTRRRVTVSHLRVLWPTMSYDILFLEKAADETWQDAMEAIDSRPYQVNTEAWMRIVGTAREILGNIDVDTDDERHWLGNEATGIAVTVSSFETSITAPYHYSGSDARGVLERMYMLGAVIESATGLAGYDPQVELTLGEAAGEIERGVASFDEVAIMFAEGR